jgi:hypothetical protein
MNLKLFVEFDFLTREGFACNTLRTIDMRPDRLVLSFYWHFFSLTKSQRYS